MERTKNNTGIIFNIALNYGGREEILHATRKIAEQVKNNRLNHEDIKEEDIERLKLCSTNQCHICGRYEKEECMLERNRCEQHLLSDYKRVLKENELLRQQNISYKNNIHELKEVRNK